MRPTIVKSRARLLALSSKVLPPYLCQKEQRGSPAQRTAAHKLRGVEKWRQSPFGAPPARWRLRRQVRPSSPDRDLDPSTDGGSVPTITCCLHPFEWMFYREDLVSEELLQISTTPSLEPADFKLHLPWDLAGDQPRAAAALIEGLRRGDTHQTL